MEALLFAILVAIALREPDPLAEHFKPTVCAICPRRIRWTGKQWTHENGRVWEPIPDQHLEYVAPVMHPALP